MACLSSGSISPKVCCAAGRDEHRIIAEALVAAGRPDDRAVDAADERLGVAVGPGEAQRGDEPGAAVGIVADTFMHHRHRGCEILRRPGPAGGIDAGRAVQRGDAEARIVRQCGQPAGGRRRHRLDPGIAGEIGSVFLGFRQAERAGGDDLDAERTQQRLDLAQLAGVVAGENEFLRRARACGPSVAQRLPLHAEQRVGAFSGERQQLEEMRPR